MCEKLTIFPYGQDIVENVVLLAFWRYSQVQDRSRVLGEMYKNVTVISRKTDLPQQVSTAHYAAKGSFIGRYAPDSPTAAFETCIRQCSLAHFRRCTRTHITTREARM